MRFLWVFVKSTHCNSWSLKDLQSIILTSCCFCATFTFSKKNHLFPKGPKNVTSIVEKWDHFGGVQTSESSSESSSLGPTCASLSRCRRWRCSLSNFFFGWSFGCWFFGRPNHFRCNFSIKESCKKRMRKVGHQKHNQVLVFWQWLLATFMIKTRERRKLLDSNLKRKVSTAQAYHCWCTCSIILKSCYKSCSSIFGAWES